MHVRNNTDLKAERVPILSLTPWRALLASPGPGCCKSATADAAAVVATCPAEFTLGEFSGSWRSLLPSLNLEIWIHFFSLFEVRLYDLLIAKHKH